MIAVTESEGPRDRFEIFEAVMQLANSQALRYLMDPHAAADVAGFVASRLVDYWAEHPETAPKERALPNYVRKSVRRVLRDRAKTEAKEDEAQYQYFAERTEGPQATANPLQQIIDHEREETMRRAVESLAPQCQRVFRLVRDGLSYEQAATQLGISKHTAHTHLTRANKALRAAKKKYDANTPLPPGRQAPEPPRDAAEGTHDA